MTMWNYKMEGTAAGGQTWEVEGEVHVPDGTDFSMIAGHAMKAAFQQLTMGRARYGNPGIGCQGPYKINRFSTERAFQ